MSFYGQRDSFRQKQLSLRLQSSGTAAANNYLNGKKLMILINQDSLKYDSEKRHARPSKMSVLHWLPANPKNPTHTQLTF
jgi:hypothetical protein